MKKIFSILAFAFLCLSILTGCNAVNVVVTSCNLELNAVGNTVNFSLNFRNLEDCESYDLTVNKGETEVYNKTFDITETTGSIELEYNTKYTVNVYIAKDRLITSKDITTEKNSITGVVFENRTFVYDGTAKSIAVSNLPEGATVVYLGNNVTEAGEHTVTAIVSKDGCEDLRLTAIITILKTDKTFEIANKEVTYDGKPHTIKASSKLDLNYEYYSGDTKLEGAPVDVGVYTVKAIFAGNATTNACEATATLTIKQAQAKITVSEEEVEFAFNQEVKLPKVTSNFGTLSYVIKSNNVEVTEMVNAGVYEVIYTVEATDNYLGATATVTVVINPIEVKAPEVTGTYVYNGSEQTVTIVGLEDYMIVEGNKATNAGTHTVEITYLKIMVGKMNSMVN